MEPFAPPTPNPNRKPNRFVAAFSILFLFSCLGGLGGYILWGSIPPIYESEALFRDSSCYDPDRFSGEVKPGISELDLTVHVNQKHDQLITRPSLLIQCVATKDLASLESFSDPLQQDKIVPTLTSNLDCEPIPGKSEYRLTCRSSSPEDAKTILSSLLNTYKVHVADQQDRDIASYKSALLDAKTVAKNDLRGLGPGQDTIAKQQSVLRLEEVERKLLDLELAKALLSDGVPVSILVLEKPNHGERVLEHGTIRFLHTQFNTKSKAKSVRGYLTLIFVSWFVRRLCCSQNNHADLQK